MYPTTISTWAFLIRKALDAGGLDSKALFEQAGLVLSENNNPDSRVPTKAMQDLWRLVERQVDDPCFGLEVARYWHPSHFHALGYAWLASETLLDAYRRLARYGHIMNDALEISLEENAGEMLFRFGWNRNFLPGDQAAPVSIDASMATLVHMSRFIYGNEFKPLHMMVMRARPACMSDYTAYFQCGIEFEAEYNGFIIAREMMEKPLPTGHQNLALLHDQVLIDYLSKLGKADISMQVKKKLVDNLSSGVVTEEKMAESLHMSLRSLQRKLQQQGTNYKKLLDETRKELALSYVKDKQRSFSEITFLLGFSEQSNFTRAFKRWKGVAPSEYREVG